LVISKKTNFDFGQFEGNQSLFVTLNFTDEVMCQVEKKQANRRKNRKLQFIFDLIVIVCHFMKKPFKIAKKILSACPKIHQSCNQEMLELDFSKMQLYLFFST